MGLFDCTKTDHTFCVHFRSLLSRFANKLKNISEMKSWCFVDCSTDRDDIIVASNSSTYNSTGEISCKNNGTLFYLNGTGPAPNQTTCSASAEWSGIELKCIGKSKNHLLNNTKIVLVPSSVPPIGLPPKC